MKKFRINSIIFIAVIAAIFGCNLFYLVRLYQSIRADVEREVLTALADTDIDDMWERSERARMIAQADGRQVMTQEEADSIFNAEHGTISGSVDNEGNFTTRAKYDNGDEKQQRFPLIRSRSYTNQMVKAMSQQMHESMDKYYGYDLNITDSIFAARLADRRIYPEFVAIEIVADNDSVLLGNARLPDGTEGYDVFRLCFNPESGWIYRACVTPLTSHILSQMMGVIITIFLLMVAFAAAFLYLFRTVSKLRTIEEMKDDFVSNMTHELKTPISIAYLANDALLNYDTANAHEKKVAYLTIALKQLDRLGELVENILAMSMERRRTMTLKPVRIALPDLLDEIAAAQRMRADKDIAIDICVEEPVVVTADRTHMSNVLNNLIDNAIKYSKESVAISITVNRHSIVVADVMMPRLDGFAMAREIRRASVNVPIIFLTAKSTVDDVEQGFDIGANDYLKKPFELRELLVRIRAGGQTENVAYAIGSYIFDATAQQLRRNGNEAGISNIEARILEKLAANIGRTVDASELMIAVWGRDELSNRNSLHGYIHKLRRALRHDPDISIINQRGFGYMLTVKK